MATLNLPVHSYRLHSGPASTARLVNCHAAALPPDAKSRILLSRVAGPKTFATVGSGPIRGMHKFLGDAFVVSGAYLYKVQSDGTATSIGAISGSGAVSMDHNIDSLVIVAQPDGYYTDGATVTQITDTDFTSRGAKYVQFLDNYMTFMEPDTGRIFWADVGTVTDYDSLNFVTAEGAPDDLVGFKSDHLQAVLLGEDSGEIFEFTTNGLERSINGFFEVGCLNGDTIEKFDNSIVWVAHDYTVRRLDGATPQRISTPAVEQFISSVDVSTLRAFSYDQDGHFFYVLCCSSGCFAYDVASGEWAERATYPYDYYKWQYHCYAHGRHYVGDFYSGAVCYMDHDTYTENAGIQRMEATFQPVYAENRRARHNRLEIVLESGVGLTSGQGSDPEIMAAFSDDGGRTWLNLPNRKMGKMGEYTDRVYWTGLGSARQRVYRIAISDPVKVAITDAILDAEGARL